MDEKQNQFNFIDWLPLLPLILGIAVAVVLFIFPPGIQILPASENNSAESFILQSITPLFNNTNNTLRLSISFLAVSLGASITVMFYLIHIRSRFKSLEKELEDELPPKIEDKLFQSVGFASASKYGKLKDPLIKILTSYDAASTKGVSNQLLDYATEGIQSVSDMMERLPEGRLALEYNPDFYLSSWQNRLEAAPAKTICVATSLVDKQWWDTHESWLKFNCDTMDKKDFTWIRIFLFRDIAHRQSLEIEMRKQADKGIKVFSCMVNSVKNVQLHYFQDMMLVNCSIEGFKEKQSYRMTISNSSLLGTNTVGVQDIAGLQISENKQDIEFAIKSVNAWLQASTPFESRWYETFFDEKYQEIADFKENDTEDEVEGIIKHLQKTGRKKKDIRILDVACAHGRTAIQLAKQEYNVVGIDICNPLIEKAKKTASDLKISNVRFETADISQNNTHLGSYRVAISIFNSFGYYDTDIENNRVLNKIYSLLETNGLFILDVDDKKYFIEKRRGKEEPTTESDHFIWGKGKFKVKCYHSYEEITLRRRSRFVIQENGGTIGPIEKPLVSVRLFEEHELKQMLIKAGFGDINVYSDFTFSNYSPGSTEHMIFVATKTIKK